MYDHARYEYNAKSKTWNYAIGESEYSKSWLVFLHSVADPDHFDTDPTFHFDTNPDPALQFDPDTDPTVFDTDPDHYHFKEVMYPKQYRMVLFVHLN